MTYADVRKFVATPLKELNFPCHTQMVEMNVKLTSFVTAQVTGNKRQVGQALAIKGSIAALAESKPKCLKKD